MGTHITQYHVLQTNKFTDAVDFKYFLKYVNNKTRLTPDSVFVRFHHIFKWHFKPSEFGSSNYMYVPSSTKIVYDLIQNEFQTATNPMQPRVISEIAVLDMISSCLRMNVTEIAKKKSHDKSLLGNLLKEFINPTCQQSFVQYELLLYRIIHEGGNLLTVPGIPRVETDIVLSRILSNKPNTFATPHLMI